MIFNFSAKTFIKCKTAKFIRLPIVCRTKCYSNNFSVTAENNQNSDLFIYEHDTHRTVFWITADTIRFANHMLEEYRDVKLITVSDYKSITYNVLGIKSQKYEEEPIMFIKTPNGDLYCVFDYTSYDYSIELDDMKRRVFTINNLTKGKVLFSYENKKRFSSYFEDDLDEKLFPIFSYTEPLYNSFIIVMRTDTYNILEKTCVYLIDLLEEKVEEIHYDLKGYIKTHINNFDSILKERYKIVLRAAALFLKPRVKLYRLLPPDSLISAWGKISDDCKLIKYQDEIPIYSQCESTFWLILKSTVFNRTIYQERDWETELSCAVNIHLSTYIENNELNVLLTCKKIKINVSGIEHINSNNDVLLHKKYPINNKYNINKSQLYSISTITKDYLFKDGNLYKLIDGSYKLLYNRKNVDITTLRSSGVYFITINDYRVFAVVRPKLVRENKSYIHIRSDCILDWKKINKIIDTYREQNKSIAILDITEYIKKISITDLIESIEKEIQKRNIKYKDLYYKLYLSGKTGILYIFIALYHIKPPRITFAIAKCDIKRKRPHIKIIFLSNPYKLESRSQLPYGEQIQLKKQGRLLNEIINKIANTEDKNIYFFDFLSRVFENANKKYGVFQVYDGELIVKHNIPVYKHDDRFIVKENIPITVIKDIRYNRKYELLFEGKNETSVISETKKPDIQLRTYRYGKILFHWTEIEIERVKRYKHLSVMVVSEMELVYATKIDVYEF